MDEKNGNRNDEIYTQRVKAGKRTYFFDVKSTKSGDFYLTITESKKIFKEGGSPFYEKHKIFLYKEDFAKFEGALGASVGFIRDKMPEVDFDEFDQFEDGNA